MKKITRMLVLALALVAALSLGAGSTAEAAKKKVTVKKVTSVDKLTGKKTITLTKGKKATLKTTVTVTPNKAANKKVTYKTSNKSVATVSSKGVIAAKKAGSAKITVVSKKNSKKKATVKVKVVNGKVTKVKVSVPTKTVKVGGTVTAKAKVTTKGKKPNKTVKWTSSNTAVATVSSKGVVTAKKAGTAKITATATDGTKKKSYVTITVKEYTVTPKDANTSVDLEYTSAADVQEDLNALAALGIVKDGSFKVTLNGTPYTAEVKGGKVTINGKSIADHAKATGATKVTVSANVQVSDIAKLVAFAPKSVKSVTVAETVITEITGTSFKIGTTTLGYAIDDKGVITINAADGDVVKAFEKLTAAKLVEVQ